MIDRENEIYTAVRQAALTEFPSLAMSSEYKQEPSKFPYVYLHESGNIAYRNSQDSGSLENHAIVTYTAEVYSNKENGKKSEAKAIANVVDNAMQRLGFTRTLKEPFPNESDATIYRIVMRYRAVIGKDGNVYTG